MVKYVPYNTNTVVKYVRLEQDADNLFEHRRCIDEMYKKKQFHSTFTNVQMCGFFQLAAA